MVCQLVGNARAAVGEFVRFPAFDLLSLRRFLHHLEMLLDELAENRSLKLQKVKQKQS